MSKLNPYSYKGYLIHTHPVYEDVVWVEKESFVICRVTSTKEAERQIDIITEGN